MLKSDWGFNVTYLPLGDEPIADEELEVSGEWHSCVAPNMVATALRCFVSTCARPFVLAGSFRRYTTLKHGILGSLHGVSTFAQNAPARTASARIQPFGGMMMVWIVFSRWIAAFPPCARYALMRQNSGKHFEFGMDVLADQRSKDSSYDF
jgi:hypothetical protein